MLKLNPSFLVVPKVKSIKERKWETSNK